MTTTLMDSAPTRSPNTVTRAERSVREIITRGRAAPAGGRWAWGLSLLAAALSYAMFTPLDWGWLGWVALVPVLLLCRMRRKTSWMYTALTVSSFAGWLATLQWMRLGDPTMYPAWVALSLYLALYLSVFVALTRGAVHRLGAPLIIAAPVAWTGLEFFRAHLMTGFAWYFLGHTQHHWTELIQISDLVGAYGVSFVVMLTSACIAQIVPERVYVRLRLLATEEQHHPENYLVPLPRLRWNVAVCLAVVAMALTYGLIRRGQADFEAGPRVALIQGNFPTSIKHDPQQWNDMYRLHRYLTGQTVPHQPDLVVWPETMFRWPLFQYAPGMTDEQLANAHPRVPLSAWKSTDVQNELINLSEEVNAPVIIGLDAFEAAPGSTAHYNSAAFVVPEKGIISRYDKLHRVPFGEFIPLRDEVPWLAKLTPFGDDFGIDAGRQIRLFDDGRWRYAPLICFEDTVPQLVRQVIAASAKEGRPADLLVNLTNDGWFHGSSELDQHLITARFRCIETRTPMVRAVNTGISAMIDGDGLVVEPEVFIDLDGLADGSPRESMRDPETGRFHKQLNCALVSPVPLDPRTSLYVRCGDWFGALCAACCLCLMAAGLVLKPKPATSPV